MVPTVTNQIYVDHWLRVEEAAELLKVSTRTIYNLIHEKTLPAQRVGNKWRIKRDDVLNLSTSHEAS